MNPFEGFLANSEVIPVPALFFARFLEEIDDLAEMQCSLRALFLLHQQKGRIRFITQKQLENDLTLRRAIKQSSGVAPICRLQQAIEGCVRRGLLLRIGVKHIRGEESLLFLHNPDSRRTIVEIRTGELALPGFPEVVPIDDPPMRRGIFQLYEESIGILTPLVGEKLQEMESDYPLGWIEEAIRTAALQNHHSLAYVEAILRRWKENGPRNGRFGRYPESVSARDIVRRTIRE